MSHTSSKTFPVSIQPSSFVLNNTDVLSFSRPGTGALYEWEGGDWQCHVCRPLTVRFGWVELRQLNPAWGVEDPSLLQEERVTMRAEAAVAERVRRIGKRLANMWAKLRQVRQRGGNI